jgi:uncharacterized protein
MIASIPSSGAVTGLEDWQVRQPEVMRAISAIVANARLKLPLQRVLIFGSRARGDFRQDSDIDLAFEHTGTETSWADFVTQQQEIAPTLLALDLVDFKRAPPELQTRIVNEGREVTGAEGAR